MALPPGLVGDQAALAGSAVAAGVWPTKPTHGPTQFATHPGLLIHRALASRATEQPGAAWWAKAYNPEPPPSLAFRSMQLEDTAGGEDGAAFALLPEELLEIVLSHLDGGSVLAARLCCRSWANVLTPATASLQRADAYPDPEQFINRFTQIHSWYKHLPLRGGQTMALFLGNGMQERNCMHPGTDGTNDVHWHYRMFALHAPQSDGFGRHRAADVAAFATLPAIVRENAVQLNCFVGRPNAFITTRRNGGEAMRAFAREFHPQTLSIRGQDGVDSDQALPLEEVDMNQLYCLEKRRLDEEIRTACRKIVQYCRTTPVKPPPPAGIC